MSLFRHVLSILVLVSIVSLYLVVSAEETDRWLYLGANDKNALFIDNYAYNQTLTRHTETSGTLKVDCWAKIVNKDNGYFLNHLIIAYSFTVSNQKVTQSIEYQLRERDVYNTNGELLESSHGDAETWQSPMPGTLLESVILSVIDYAANQEICQIVLSK